MDKEGVGMNQAENVQYETRTDEHQVLNEHEAEHELQQIISLDDVFKEASITAQVNEQMDGYQISIVDGQASLFDQNVYSLAGEQHGEMTFVNEQGDGSAAAEQQTKKRKRGRRARVSSLVPKVIYPIDKKRKCTRCFNHDKIDVGVKDHNCPFKNCDCDTCLLILWVFLAMTIIFGVRTIEPCCD